MENVTELSGLKTSTFKLLLLGYFASLLLYGCDYFNENKNITNSNLEGLWQTQKPIISDDIYGINMYYKVEFLENQKSVTTIGDVQLGGEYSISDNKVFISTGDGTQYVWDYSSGVLSSFIPMVGDIQLVKVKQ